MSRLTQPLRLRYSCVMFWRRRKVLLAAPRNGRASSAVFPTAEQMASDDYYREMREDFDRKRIERLLADQKVWPDIPWPVDTEEDRQLLLDAQQSIDGRYAERHPVKTYTRLTVLRTAAEMGGISLADVLPYIETFQDTAHAAEFISQGLPLEYAIALQENDDQP